MTTKRAVGKTGTRSKRGIRTRRLRHLVDIAMVALLLFQMTRQFLPGAVHEATGIALGAAVVVHNVANRHWWASLPHGRWTAHRVLLTAVDATLLACCTTCVACGLGMSGVAVELGLAGHTMALRSAHMALTHWVFVLAGVHPGLHAQKFAGRIRKAPGTGRAARGTRIAMAAVVTVLVVWGAYAFAELDFPGYLSGQVRFAFIDPTQSVVLFVLNHLAVFLLFAIVGWAAWQAANRLSPTRDRRNRRKPDNAGE